MTDWGAYLRIGARVIVVQDCFLGERSLLTGRCGTVRHISPHSRSLAIDVRLDKPLPTGNANFWFSPHELKVVRRGA